MVLNLSVLRGQSGVGLIQRLDWACVGLCLELHAWMGPHTTPALQQLDCVWCCQHPALWAWISPMCWVGACSTPAPQDERIWQQESSNLTLPPLPYFQIFWPVGSPVGQMTWLWRPDLSHGPGVEHPYPLISPAFLNKNPTSYCQIRCLQFIRDG